MSWPVPKVCRFCRLPAVGRYLIGWTCADHTPAAQAGRTEPPPVDLATWLATHPARPRREHVYGSRTVGPGGGTLPR